AMLVRQARAVADEDFPERHHGLGHACLRVAYSAAARLLAARAACFLAYAIAASRTQAPSCSTCRRTFMRWRLQGPSPASTRLNSDQSMGPICQCPVASSSFSS